MEWTKEKISEEEVSESLQRIRKILDDDKQIFDVTEVLADVQKLTDVQYEQIRDALAKRIGFRLKKLDSIKDNSSNSSSSSDSDVDDPYIRNDDGALKSIAANALTMLKTSPEWEGVLAFNQMSLHAEKLKPTPWSNETENWNDADDVRLAEWFQHKGLFIDNAQKIAQIVETISREKSYHPVRDYLNSLKWDGNKRLDSWLTNCLGVTQDDYSKAIGKAWMISAVARVYIPGCQADYTLSLFGPQGRLKSTALRILTGDRFFSDNIGDIENKDSLLAIHAAWIVEFSELSSIRKAESEKVKSFLTRRVDMFRPPFGRRIGTYPRENVFVATTNEDRPFIDPTGNRRFWPVNAGTIEIQKLKDERDMLWAEAVQCFKNGDHWWLTESQEGLANAEQDSRYAPGQWDETIEAWLENPQPTYIGKEKIGPYNSSDNYVTITDVLVHCIAKPLDRITQADQYTVRRCLLHNGWTQPKGCRKKLDGRTIRFYQRPPKPKPAYEYTNPLDHKRR